MGAGGRITQTPVVFQVQQLSRYQLLKPFVWIKKENPENYCPTPRLLRHCCKRFSKEIDKRRDNVALFLLILVISHSGSFIWDKYSKMDRVKFV